MPIPYFFSKFIYIYKLNEESLSQRIVFVSFSVGFLATVGRKKIKIGFSSITRSRRRVTKDGDNKIYFERKKKSWWNDSILLLKVINTTPPAVCCRFPRRIISLYRVGRLYIHNKRTAWRSVRNIKKTTIEGKHGKITNEADEREREREIEKVISLLVGRDVSRHCQWHYICLACLYEKKKKKKRES